MSHSPALDRLLQGIDILEPATRDGVLDQLLASLSEIQASDNRKRNPGGGLPVVRCRGVGCDKRIVWGIEHTAKGAQKRPLDPSPPIYRVDDVSPNGVVIVTRDRHALVSHFVTCSDANAFSAGKRRS